MLDQIRSHHNICNSNFPKYWCIHDFHKYFHRSYIHWYPNTRQHIDHSKLGTDQPSKYIHKNQSYLSIRMDRCKYFQFLSQSSLCCTHGYRCKHHFRDFSQILYHRYTHMNLKILTVWIMMNSIPNEFSQISFDWQLVVRHSSLSIQFPPTRFQPIMGIH